MRSLNKNNLSSLHSDNRNFVISTKDFTAQNVKKNKVVRDFNKYLLEGGILMVKYFTHKQHTSYIEPFNSLITEALASCSSF